MDVSTEGIAGIIGARVRAARHAHRWTLDEFAERSGISRRMIVMVEKGETNASVATLLSLGGALGIGLPSLVAERESATPALTEAGDGTVLWSTPAGGFAVLLAGTPAPDVLALWHWALYPGDTHVSDAHSPGTREILHVKRGIVTLGMTAETVDLHVGDSFVFSGAQPHSYSNAGDEAAEFTLVVSEPGVGAILLSPPLHSPT